jgi:DNA-directed RNA polymerase specialized sigma24 family protein
MTVFAAHPPVRIEDAAIIEAARTEPEAFAELFDRHAALIHRYIARRIGTEIADDVTAETFLVAFRRRRQYDCSYADARPWLYGIATHLVSQHRRDESRQLRVRNAISHPALAEPGHEERVARDMTAIAVRGWCSLRSGCQRRSRRFSAMNDLDLITSMRPDVPLATPQQLAGPRELLAAAITDDDLGYGRSNRGNSPSNRSPKRAFWWGTAGAVAGLAVAAGVTIALVIWPAAGPAAPIRHQKGQPSPPLTALTAAQWLDGAAVTIRDRTAAVPRPDQYIYTESGSPGVTPNDGAWLSVNGTRPAFFGDVSGHGGHVEGAACPVAAAEKGKCALNAGYLPHMPTTERALAAFLVKIKMTSPVPGPKGVKNWLANYFGKNLLTMFTSMYFTPPQRAALFQVMARTHGFFLTRHAVDPSGRVGVGIAWTYNGGTVTMIFNSRSYAFLGWTAGPKLGASLLRQAIVNKPAYRK